jgi:hypothetical protein
MPHFLQLDPRFFGADGEDYCGPTSASDYMLYLAAHGYPNLNLLDIADVELSQTALVERLASEKYMNTGTEPPRTGTSPSRFLYGLRKYLTERGYSYRHFQYAGLSPLANRIGKAYLGKTIDLNWLKRAIADPHGAAWLAIGWYSRGKTPGQWLRRGGHWVAVVGYGSDGSGNDPHRFLLDNPAMGPRIAIPGQGPLRSRAITLADQAVTLSPSGPGQLVSENLRTNDAEGMFQVTGPGLRFGRPIDAAFVEGAAVLVLDDPPAPVPTTSP